MSIQTVTSEAQGLLDIATLSRLAGEFFAELPGGGSNPALAPAIEAAPAGQGHAAQAPRQGGAAQGVPQAYAAALPLPSASAPTRPAPGGYYFIDEAKAPQQATAAPDPVIEDRVTPQAFGLPGQDSLKALLTDFRELNGARDASGGYYFVQPEQQRAYEARAGEPQTKPRSVPGGFDVDAVRRDFPILQERVNGRQLVWLDNAATTQKPQQVIDRLAHFYQHENSNIHRAAHELAARATDAYEGARDTVARFLGAASSEEIIFVRGATEGINLVAKSWGAKHIGAGDEIIVSHLEHHANIVPWQQLAAEKGARLRVIPVDDTGQVLLDEYRKLLNPRTKLVAVTQVSNALGTIVPVHEIVALAKAVGARTLVDGAQSVSHLRVNVQALGADFFVFSGHKVFAPTGIGVVYGRRDVLEETPPWQGGGNMIADVTFERTVYQPPPARFEAGTGNIADAVGLGAALDYLQKLGLENVAKYEHDLLEYATHQLAPIPGLRLIGTALQKTSVLSFVLQGYQTEQIGKALNDEGIAVRSGHHCAQPILRRFGLEATVRPSLAFYNTCDEIDHLAAVVKRLAHRR
ncbi:family 2A encapsulin nanocompartment cargo protein cysteine desulfurase [Paucibacter sp. R3-3]|uniref:cysteine desulfurase n=1 Tax=Roseateles agri TaxID=3098619 RepID=A0ABU5DKB8_9BURK|nr:family 2A encapsulin nanocompartment cargo protein cysteine desulfurase [Paucibacter sp. R3-3]MDY0746736.1 family 2A encapsulin nanocompartment cargo protein cysteine desulfurase [Paucibacter sp. R3-3]